MEKNNIYEKYNILSKENERLSIMNLKYRNRLLKLNTEVEELKKNLKKYKNENKKNEGI